MLIDYLPILILMIIALGFTGITVFLSHIIGRKRPTPEKLSPYECGIPAKGDARGRFLNRFYIIAVLFIVFDIEVVFLYPWAVVYKSLRIFGLIEMFIFILILLIGYIYAWRKGGLEWE